MNGLRQKLHLALLGAAGAAYAGLGYFTAVADHPPLLALLVGLAPLAALAVASAWNSRARVPALLLCAVAAAALLANLDLLQRHAAWIYFIQHAGTLTCLGIMFGSTVGAAPERALCSRIALFALRLQPDADYLRYTWRVTLAWTLFFFASALLSAAMFAFGPIEAWSVYANVLTPVFVGAMFAGEYLVRLRVLPNRAHFSIGDTLRSYREYSRR